MVLHSLVEGVDCGFEVGHDLGERPGTSCRWSWSTSQACWARLSAAWMIGMTALVVRPMRTLLSLVAASPPIDRHREVGTTLPIPQH
jgi:hypothetical protein